MVPFDDRRGQSATYAHLTNVIALWKGLIVHAAKDDPFKWEKYIHKIYMAYNSSAQASTLF